MRYPVLAVALVAALAVGVGIYAVLRGPKAVPVLGALVPDPDLGSFRK